MSICIGLLLVIFVFLEILLYLTPSSNKKKNLILIRLLAFIEFLGASIIILTLLLIGILSILMLIQEVLTVISISKVLWLLNLNLQFVFFKFFVKT